MLPYKLINRRFVREAQVYEGPELPYVWNGLLYCELPDKYRYLYKAWTSEMDCFDQCWYNDVPDIVQEALYALKQDDQYELVDNYDTRPPKWERLARNEPAYRSFVLCVFPLQRAVSLTCATCGFAVYSHQLERASFAVPLNRDNWDEWLCPQCRDGKEERLSPLRSEKKKKRKK